ncbi:MAG: dTDP-glucose 4,6-dehydratase [Fimbriimonadaceae bacterium]|nr:dTDP-glucose 4,6-dehydratase [Fimbriimonadaceae bacterium]
MRLLVTGGAGFIGTNFVLRWAQRHPADELVVLDALTYAGRRENLDPLGDQVTFIAGDIGDAAVVQRAMAGCQQVVHFAAESHVDRSLYGGQEFLRTGVMGTYTLLEAARALGVERFLMISTDEVYGPVPHGSSGETDELRPSSPYAASKAAADRLAFSYFVTYKLPVLITRSSNNYGPYQYPEKQLPFFTTQALEDQPITIYGDGSATRDWLHVDDNCAGIETVLERGEPGEAYNIGADNERNIVQNARLVLQVVGKGEELLRFIDQDKIRPGHDVRYCVDSRKLRALGWEPVVPVEDGLRATVQWYVDHPQWWREMKARGRAFFEQHYGRKG